MIADAFPMMPIYPREGHSRTAEPARTGGNRKIAEVVRKEDYWVVWMSPWSEGPAKNEESKGSEEPLTADVVVPDKKMPPTSRLQGPQIFTYGTKRGRKETIGRTGSEGSDTRRLRGLSINHKFSQHRQVVQSLSGAMSHRKQRLLRHGDREHGFFSQQDIQVLQ